MLIASTRWNDADGLRLEGYYWLLTPWDSSFIQEILEEPIALQERDAESEPRYASVEMFLSVSSLSFNWLMKGSVSSVLENFPELDLPFMSQHERVLI